MSLARWLSPLLFLLLSPAAYAGVSSVALTETEIVVTVTPGARVTISQLYWPDHDSTFAADSDGDGVIRVARPPLWQARQLSVLVADFDTAQTAFVSTVTNAPSTPEPLEPRTVLRGPSGAHTLMMFRERYDYADFEIVWLRPGVGAWRGGSTDRIHGFLGMQYFEAGTFSPMVAGVPTPAGFAHGDRLVVLQGDHPSTGGVDEDLDAPWSGGVVSFHSAGQYAPVREGQSAAIGGARTGGSDGPVSFGFEQTGGDAIAGVHYMFPPDITLKTGQLSLSAVMPFLNDTVYGGRVTLRFGLARVNGMTIGRYAENVIIIDDNDPAPLIQFASLPATVDEGDTPWTLPVTLTKSGATRVPATVGYQWTFRNTSGSGTVVFTPDEQSKTIDVPIPGNTSANDHGTMTIALSTAVDAQLPPSARRDVELRDDDLPLLDAVDTSAGEDAGVVAVSINIDVPLSTRPVSVSWSTADGTARAGRDYHAVSNQTALAAYGATATVFLIEDHEQEGPETFYLDLVATTGATIRKSRAVVTITDDLRPRVTIESVSVTEGAPGESRDVRLGVSLSHAPTGPVRFRIARDLGSTAAASADYALDASWITFAAGQTAAEGVVQIFGDAEPESDETLYLTAVDLDGVRAPATSGAITIVDDDGYVGRLRVGGTRIVEGTGGTPTVAAFPVQLTAPLGNPVFFSYRAYGGSAAAPADFQAIEGQSVLQPGETTATLLVNVTADAAAEADETFTLALFDVTGAFLERATATTTIADDDGPLPSTRRISAHDVAVREGQPEAVIALTRPATTVDAVTVSFWTVAGTAAANSDFVPAGGSVTFAPGELTKSIRVPIVDDSVREEDETFHVVLASESAPLERAMVRCTIASDDGSRRRAARH